SPEPGSSLLVPNLQHRQERLLRNLDGADALHPLLAFLLLLEQLALTRDVTAVTLRQHVLAQRLHRFASHDALPMAAWMATSNICRGMSSRIFAATARPRT